MRFGPTCLPLFSSHHPLVELLMLRKPTKSPCFLEDIRVPFDCKQQKTSHVIVFKKKSVQSYFWWNPCYTLCKFTESLHLQLLFTLQRLAFMTRRQFFPACPPFVNTVYKIWILFLDLVGNSEADPGKGPGPPLDPGLPVIFEPN